MRKYGIHLCHPWSGDCAMRALRINIRTPRTFVTIGLFGGQTQKQQADGTYGDEYTWLSIDRDWLPPTRRSGF